MSIKLEKLYFPEKFKIVHDTEGEFMSKLISLQDFPKGEILAILDMECRITKTKAYTSVQFAAETGPNCDGAHFELGSELVYMNHSCEPNVAFELCGGWNGLLDRTWTLRSLVDIKKGDELTFAYFSTEWDMERPFDCKCGSKNCLGRISGAKDVSDEVLKRYSINNHIRNLKGPA